MTRCVTQIQDKVHDELEHPGAAMASPSTKGTESPSTSLPLPQYRRRSRRGSLASIASGSQVDREAISHALDHIHHSASQSESLTTFNEYTSPPSSSSGGGKGIAAELQGGISGLYNKFRASVGNVRDKVVLAVDDINEESIASTIPQSSSAQDRVQALKPLSNHVSPSSALAAGAHSTLNLKEGQSSNPAGVIPTLSKSEDKTLKLSSSDQEAQLKIPSQEESFSLPPALLTPTAPSITAVPSLAEVNVSAIQTQTQGYTLSGRATKQNASDNAVRVEHTQAEGSLSGTASRHGVTPKNDVPRSATTSLLLRDSDAASSTGSQNSRKVAVHPPSIRQGASPSPVLQSPSWVAHAAVIDDTKRTSKQSSHDIDAREVGPWTSRGTILPQSVKVQGQQERFGEQLGELAFDGAIRPTRNSKSSLNERGALDSRSTSKQRPGNAYMARLHEDRAQRAVLTSQTKSKILSKEFWMLDENAKDCFYCGEPFSTFRRKHHCRLCGQIFDGRCTSLVSGPRFGQSGPVRICKQCESIMNTNDDSSDFSDTSSLRSATVRTRHGSASASDLLATPNQRPPNKGQPASRSSPKHVDLSIPTMTLPATRRTGGDPSRKPVVLEMGANRSLMRPPSSRSLKSAFSNRSQILGHRRTNSRHLTQALFKKGGEDSAPFHQGSPEGKGAADRLSAFHDDNIIDPDLAPYISDDSSGEEQVTIAAALYGPGTPRTSEYDRSGLSGMISASRKSKYRVGDKSISGLMHPSRDSDNVSLSSVRTAEHSRAHRRRNLSVAGNLHLRPSPRHYRGSGTNPASKHLHFEDDGNLEFQLNNDDNVSEGPRIMRSSSMKGSAAPAIELNSASLQHVRNLLRQFLQDLDIANPAGWEKALVPILLQATDDVNPDPQAGDAMDVRNYMKLKKIPGGIPGDTAYVSGVVFTKNLALKSMPRNISNPRILIITFPLEYARHQQHFMSLEPVIRQEREYLQNLVHRIAALKPHLLLVQYNVSGLALQFLEKANIATAYNVKPTVLNAVSRCCETRIITSIDKLAIKPIQTGTCASFYLKTYVHSGQRKTYMFLSGCSKSLGCTIVLRGAEKDVLVKMKRMTEFMIYVVYNLKLETCLMRDEFALSHSHVDSRARSPGRRTGEVHTQGLKGLKSNGPGQVARPDGPAVTAHGVDIAANSDLGTASEMRPAGDDDDDPSLPKDLPVPSFYSDMVEKHQTRILSASPFVKFMQPYLLMKAREQERRLVYLKRLRDQDSWESQNDGNDVPAEEFVLIQPEMVHDTVKIASKKVREVLHAVHDAEYDKALHIYETQSKNWKSYIASNDNLFDPYAHQNIAVLYSTVCTATMIPCEGPDILALGFYKELEESEEFVPDCALGQFVEQLCLDATNVCRANGCEKLLLEHHRQYVHGEAQLSVFVERYPSKIRGLHDTILMWSCCRICGTETQTFPMSEGTWRYSFGKYLELSFWSRDLHARANICPHDLHRDHLRYFGYKDMALRVQYDPVTVLEINVPRPRVTWKVENDLKFKNDVFVRIQDRINKFMGSIKTRVKGINIETVLPEKFEACAQELSKLGEKAAADHKYLIRKLQGKYMNAKHYEQIPLNKALRATQEKVAEWDKLFADFDQNYFPSEKDIRRLATLQLKRIFMERDDSSSSLTLTDDGSLKGLESSVISEKGHTQDPPRLIPQTRHLSRQKTQEMLNAVIEGDVSQQQGDAASAAKASTSATSEGTESTDITTNPADLSCEEVQHLDLAMSNDLLDKLRGDNAGEVDSEQQSGAKFESGSPSTLKAQTPSSGTTPASSNAQSKTASPEQSKIFEPKSKDFALLESSATTLSSEHDRANSRKPTIRTKPPLDRAHSQPIHLLSDGSSSTQSSSSSAPFTTSSPAERPAMAHAASTTRPYDRKFTERLGMSALKVGSVAAHSMIPRSIGSRRQHSHVSSLARHFEQLSREFEKERLKERRQRAARTKKSRAYPMPSSKPIIEVYHDVEDAVDERESSDEKLIESSRAGPKERHSQDTAQGLADISEDIAANNDFQDNTTAENTDVENTDVEDVTNPSSRIGSDMDGEPMKSDDEPTLVEGSIGSSIIEGETSLTSSEAQSEVKLDLPKHEKTSLMKMLTTFWAERTASGWQPLEYPLNATDHVFADSDIIVREDEPSSLIAFTLDSDDYRAQLSMISDQNSPSEGRTAEEIPADAVLNQQESQEVEAALNRTTGTHLKFQFQDGSAKMICRVLFAEQFHAVRRKCGVSDRIIESLSRCLKWDSKGGKTKSLFLKTLDDRFVLKSLSPIETQTFLRFAPTYFSAITESFFHGAPSVIAKMLGFYQVVIRNPNTGVDYNWSLLVMENLFYDRSPNRIFDLKGSMRNRRLQPTGEQNEVLLDENMVEFIYETPLFAREHSKKLLRWSIYNDTLFLSRVNVMDYSLMIAIDESRKELVVGIIDCIRTYTWDKRLESWIKDRGKNKPTVTSPKDYKNRFREAMGRYVLQAPNCWHQFGTSDFPGRQVRSGEPVGGAEKVIEGGQDRTNAR